jgi:hypothetical protein
MTVNQKGENLNTVSYIENVCKEYKEDYHKPSLADYLLDDGNRGVIIRDVTCRKMKNGGFVLSIKPMRYLT